jgi:hypothetical protein
MVEYCERPKIREKIEAYQLAVKELCRITGWEEQKDKQFRPDSLAVAIAHYFRHGSFLNSSTLQSSSTAMELLRELENPGGSFPHNSQKLDEALPTPSLDAARAAERKLSGFDPVVRIWVKDRITSWWTDEHWTRAFVLKGAAGMGKSVISSQLLRGSLIDQDQLRMVVGAAHFFDFSNKDTSDLAQMMYSIAKQLTRIIPDLAKVLENDVVPQKHQLKDQPVEEQFRAILADPCRKTQPPPNARVVIIFDALDECNSKVRLDLLGLLQNDFITPMPDWVGFFLTTRNEEYVDTSLGEFKPTELDAEQEKNEQDMQLFFKHRLQNVGLSENELEQAVEILTARSKGLFLYARFVHDTLTRLLTRNKVVTLEDIRNQENFASGMRATYKNYFARFKKEALGDDKDLYFELLGPMVAARDLVPLQLVENALEAKVNQGDERSGERAARLRGLIERVSNLVVLSTDTNREIVLQFVHKSMKDWLIDEKSNPVRQGLYISIDDAQKYLAKILQSYDQTFAYQHLLYHQLCAKQFQRAAELLMDPKWLLKAIQHVPPNQLVMDAKRYGGEEIIQDAKQVLRVLEIGSNALQHEPLELASQLFARLPRQHPILQRIEHHYQNEKIRWLKPLGMSLTPADSPLRKILQGNSSSVLSLAISADGRTVVSGSGDTTVRVWDVQSGACTRTLQGHSKEVMSVAISADGRTVVSGSLDKTVRVWDVQSDACTHTLQGHSKQVSSVAISADGRTVVSSSYSRKKLLWDLRSGRQLDARPADADFRARGGEEADVDRDGYRVRLDAETAGFTSESRITRSLKTDSHVILGTGSGTMHFLEKC